MTAYSGLQEREFENERLAGYKAVKHQSFVGTGYFDLVAQVVTSGHASTTALARLDRGGAVPGGPGELTALTGGGRTPCRTKSGSRGRRRPRAIESSRGKRWPSWPSSRAASGSARDDLLDRRTQRQEDFARGIEPGFSEHTRDHPRSRLDGGAGAPGPPGPPGRDHRPGRAQDDDQRPQLGGERLHGRLRGLPLPHLDQRRRGAGEPDGRRPAADRLPQPRRQGVPAERPDRHPARPPARLAPARAARARSTASPSRPASSTSASTSSTTPRSSWQRGSGPYFYLPKLESHLEARLWNEVFVDRPGRARHPARHHPRHRAHRDHHRRLRDGRDPLRAARARRRPQRRTLGLHLQHHPQVPREPASCCPTASRSP